MAAKIDGRISANRDAGAAPLRSCPSSDESRRANDPGPACARNRGDGVRVGRFQFQEGSLTTLDNSDKFSDNAAVQCCPRPKKCLVVLVELTRIERATS